MIRVFLFFAGGIGFALCYPHAVSHKTAVVCILVGVLGYVFVFSMRWARRWNVMAGVLGSATMVVMGFARTAFFTDIRAENHLVNHRKKIVYYVAEITKPAEATASTWRYELRIKRVSDGRCWEFVTGKVLLYISRYGTFPNLSYGSTVLIKGAPTLVAPPKNPHEFNYKKFLAYKNIYHTHFVRSDHLLRVSPRPRNDMWGRMYAARNWAMENIKKYIPERRARAVVLALTLGISDGLDNILRNTYAASGAMHVLAVSGLHVGIIYGVILWLLTPLKTLRGRSWMVAIISLFFLWSYAFITGLSPSVLRAVTMFSFVAIARLLGRQANVYNTLAGSAFLLLLFNPYLLASVGFQLSYLAVFGIVFVYRSLYWWWEPRHVLWDRLWSITCISIAAQLATFSLGLFYFHQFPIYFLLSNFFALPGAAFILIGSLFLLVASPIPLLASWVGMAVQAATIALNYGLSTIEKLPFSLMQDIYISGLECVLLMTITFFAVSLLREKKFRYLIPLFCSVLIFAGSRWTRFYTEVWPGRLVVYAIPGHTAIEWIERGTSRFLSDKKLFKNPETMAFYVHPNRLFCGVKRDEVHRYELAQKSPLTLFCRAGIRIAIVNKPLKTWPLQGHFNYLIVSGDAFRSLQEIRNTCSFDQLILSSNNTARYCARIKQEDAADIVYSVLDQGAYVEKL